MSAWLIEYPLRYVKLARTPAFAVEAGQHSLAPRVALCSQPRATPRWHASSSQ